jgi:uncharacterized protein (DUF1697 family)
MMTWICLLRGINVSGQNSIKMVDLCRVFEELGCKKVQTYVQSGNVVFESDEFSEAPLASRLEQGIESAFNACIPIILRHHLELVRVVTQNPFLAGGQADTSTLYVTFFHSQPLPGKIENLARPAGCDDEFRIGEREVFLSCPGGYGKSKLSNSFFEKKLSIGSTTRNWKTLTTLFQMTEINPG